MSIDEEDIRKLLKTFDLGEFKRLVRVLDSGFQSDNYLIQTQSGLYVVRIIHESPESVEKSMAVHEYLADNGIKTARPMRTKQGDLYVISNEKVIVVQSYIEGADIYEPLDAIDPLLPFFGRELGRIHQVTLRMMQEVGAENLSGSGDTISYVQRASHRYMSDNKYVKEQFELWAQDIKELPKDQLTKAVIHGDVGPKDFFFKDGEFTGILDFNAAQLDFLLFDIASMMMYSKLILPERTGQYITFMTNYLETAPIRKEELQWLHVILRTRWFVQIFYHNYRYVEGITQGQDSNNVDENLVGVEDGIRFLKLTNDYPADHFYRLLVN